MTLIRDYIDQLLTNFLLLGRGTNAIALKMSGSGLLELKDTADSAYQDLRLRNLLLDGYLSNSRVPVARRQCVLGGKVNSGLPSLFTLSGGLPIQLDVSTTQPCVVSFAAGFDTSGGAIDYVQHVTSTLSQTLPASSTSYLYLERNSSSTTITNFSRATQAPIYSRTAPSSPASGQHWFCTAPTINTGGQTGMTMYEWSGSAWVARQRVFVGEAVTGSSTITSTVTYAYQRRYQSAWASVGLSQGVNFAHNLGMTLAEAEATYSFFARLSSSDANHAIAPFLLYAGAGYGVQIANASNSRLNQLLTTGDSGIFQNTSGTWQTSADLQVVINGGW